MANLCLHNRDFGMTEALCRGFRTGFLSDADYHHQPNELNVWIPLTDCLGSDTLWAESEADRGDFRPFELRVGEMMLFWGSQCLHYTVPNETEATRRHL